MKTLARWASALLGTAAAFFCLSAYLVSPPDRSRIDGVCNDARGLPSSIPPDREIGWRVAVISDVQSGFRYLPRILERAERRDPSATVILGDLSADHDENHMQLPVRELKACELRSPILAIPGNHDIRGDAGAAEWGSWFGPRTFDFQVQDARLVGLDNSQGPLDAQGLAALKAKLEKLEGRHAILCLHRDVVDWEGKRRMGAEEANRALLDLIKGYDIPLVLMGHWHQAVEVVKGKTKFVVVPPSGDTSRDTGALPVTLTILKYDGKGFTIEYERIERDFWTDLEGFYIHMALAHVRPQPLWTFGALIACAAGWWLFIRWKRASAPSTIAPEVKT